ncbi:MAG TPA: hypothetical protein VKX29_00050 [Brumimicrobium sp.]|nr:hypothetical protein [Brumimicrobium sp.]
MKLIYLVLSCLILLTACGNSKETNAKDDNQFMKDDYIFNIEVIDNQMPSTSPKGTIYAVVSLSPKTDMFKCNWELSNFEINGVSYNMFDDNKFKCKDQLIYQANVREIPHDIKPPLSVNVKFKNDKGKVITYHEEGLGITKVH